MTDYVGINHDIRNVNGCSIQMPPWFSGEPDKGWGNLTLPNVYIHDTVQKYPHGTAFREGERTWFYAKFKGTVDSASASVCVEELGYRLTGKGLTGHAFAEDYAAGTVRGILGEPTLYLGPTSTVTGTGTQAANDFYSGGYLNINDDHFQHARILTHGYSGTTITVDGTELATPSTITIDHDLLFAVSASATARVMPNKWKHATWFWSNAGAIRGVIIGACMVSEPIHSTWMWLQTYGPMSTRALTSGTAGGQNVETRVYWSGDGSLDYMMDGATDTNTVRARQFAGYTMAHTMSETNSGQDELYPMIFLQMER